MRILTKLDTEITSVCAWIDFFSLRHFFFLYKFPISICRSPDTFWRWKPRTWAHEIEAGFGYSRFSIKPWWNSFFQRCTGFTCSPKAEYVALKGKIKVKFFCLFCFFFFSLSFHACHTDKRNLDFTNRGGLLWKWQTKYIMMLHPHVFEPPEGKKKYSYNI